MADDVSERSDVRSREGAETARPRLPPWWP